MSPSNWHMLALALAANVGLEDACVAPHKMLNSVFVFFVLYFFSMKHISGVKLATAQPKSVWKLLQRAPYQEKWRF